VAWAAGPFTIATDLVALELENPTLATPSFINATGNGANAWKNLSYAQLANAYDQGLILQSALRISTPTTRTCGRSADPAEK